MEIPRELLDCGAETAIVLGSGLGPFADSLPKIHSIPYDSIEGLPTSGVPGHAGRFLVTELCGRPLLVAQGRVHLYEGWSAQEVVRHVDLMHTAGIKKLLLTNAAGTVNRSFEPGSWMMISDHINLTGHTPLRGGPNFIDMTHVYSARIREIFRASARALGVPLHEGVYAAMNGPQFETPAEIRMAQILGADAVGMSTVPEATKARFLGLEVAGFSCLTNWGAGLSGAELAHEDVTAVGRQAAGRMVELLLHALPAI
ncbi:MAG: purine-nucleoside phosphorylase [Verrucomicrobia bacterium]|nr:purine-nucleoside phosphorylase [Verrucomicrobiota bacterium]